MYDVLLEKLNVADTSPLRLSLLDMLEHERAPPRPEDVLNEAQEHLGHVNEDV